MNAKTLGTLALGLIGTVLVCGWTSSQASLLNNEGQVSNTSTVSTGTTIEAAKIGNQERIIFPHVPY